MKLSRVVRRYRGWVAIDDATVVAYVEGAGELTAGASVMVIAAPAGDPSSPAAAGVATASIVVVR